MTTPAQPPRSPGARIAAGSVSRAAASPVPLMLGAASVTLSVVVAVVVAASASAPIGVLGVDVPLVRVEFFWLSLLGVGGWYVWANVIPAIKQFIVKPQIEQTQNGK